MKLIKMNERTKGSGRLITHGVKAIGAKVSKLNRYAKWIEVAMGKLHATMDLYEVNMPDGKKVYGLIDTLGQLACELLTDKNEVLTYLNEHGWKVEHEVEYEDEEEEE